MRRNWLFLALLLSVGVNCGLLGIGIARHRMIERWAADRADPGEAGDRRQRPRFGEGTRLADRLELTGETRENFLRLQRELAERVHAGRRSIDESRRLLRRELVDRAPDRGKVEELLTAILREQEALDRALVANVFSAREILDGRAEREYLRFVERFGAAVAGPPPPHPPGAGPRPRFGGRWERRPGGETDGRPDDGPPPPWPDGPPGPPDADPPDRPLDRDAPEGASGPPERR